MRRVGGRLILLDPDCRVLLIHERTGEGAMRHWLTPGGGLEPGETPQQAAVRETYEETGIEVALPGDAPRVHVQQRLWNWDGVTYDQTDHFYRAAVPAGVDVRPVALTDAERQTRLGHRWWSVDELRSSDDVFVPPDIAHLVERRMPTPRTAGRVLLLDEHDRVLLLEHYTEVGARTTHWITPGGGAELGETPAAAAARELFEETGVRIELPDDEPAVHRDQEMFGVNGRSYDQTNHYYLVRIASDTPLNVRGVDEIERALLIRERWWSLAELQATAAVMYPTGLSELLAGLLYGDRSQSA